MSQGRLWIIVWNNYPANFCEILSEVAERDNVEWLAVTEEVAPTTGTRHLQGNIYTQRKITKGGLVRLLDIPAIHVGDRNGRPCYGNVGANLDYITKTGVKLFEWGHRPPLSTPGAERRQPTDWGEIRDLAKAGRFDDIEHAYPREFIMYGPRIRTLYRPPVQTLDRIDVRYIFGNAGIGKDHYVRTTWPGLYLVERNGEDWTGYMNEEVVYIPDVSPTFFVNFGLQRVKQLFDKWPLKVRVLYGGDKLIRPKTVIMTSNYPFEHALNLIPHAEHEPLRRRVQVFHMPHRGVVTPWQTPPTHP